MNLLMTFAHHLSAFRRFVKADIQNQFSGTYLGFTWAFIPPLVSLTIIHFVFTFGLKPSNIGDVPFSSWLTVGMVPWFFLSEGISSSSNAILEYKFLFKKTAINMYSLPLAKLAISCVTHLFILNATLIYLLINDVHFSITWFMLPYYIFCGISLLIGSSFFLSTLTIFIKDTPKYVSIFIQVFFWFTPILWNSNMIPNNLKWVLLINPFYYIINGYRNSLVFNSVFEIQSIDHLIFWFLTIGLFISSLYFFKKARPIIAEMS
ncbi:ABC transporter permease [Bacteriovoracaceae bacterium]|nr:ABC transporter permease [Bacteriovoracaceae bacterium]